ncbi:hypothetical protein MKW92_053711 [Papaver armeniacum]|nr:hypothetical protein MKW92_053711 [Papaver armeniacum]
MAVLSLDTPSFTSQLNSSISMESSSPLLSPSPSVLSEKEDYWSTLRNRVDTLLENRQSINQSLELPVSSSRKDEDDCLLLLRGFDSISSSLIQLKGNLHKALEGARDLSKPSLTETLQNDAEKSEEGSKSLKKRRHDDESDEQSIYNQKGGDELKKDNDANLKNGKLKKAKNLAISMAANAATLARELKSIRSDLSFMQERCDMLEEENMRLRNGSDKPEEDDLVRLQLEALLAEKSRLATENANLIRENQCLHQLVEYHQLTCSSEDMDQTYEQVVRGMCLDFSSPSSDNDDSNSSEIDAPSIPRSDIVGFATCLDQCYEEDEEHK